MGTLVNTQASSWASKKEQKAKILRNEIEMADNKPSSRVPITLRDLFWQDPFFSTNWEDFHKLHDEMMQETRSMWQKFDDKNFELSLDTSHYRPDEIKVTVNGDVLTVEADHEEKAEDGTKHVARRFMRKYTLPQGCRPETVTSNLSSDGVLMITAPKLAIEGPKNVPIQQ